MNLRKLDSIMVLHGDTNFALAKAMGIRPQTLSLKRKNVRSEFNQREIAFIRERYRLSASEVDEIFFDR